METLSRGEAAIRANEARLRVIQDQAPIGIYELDIRGHFQRVNDRICLITGYDREALLGKRFSEVVHTDDLAHIEAGFERLASGEIQTYRSEKRYLRPDGRIVWVDVHRFAVSGEDGHERFIVGLVEDITERKLAAQEAMAREVRFRELADGVPVLTWVAGRSGYEFVNAAYHSFTGAEDAGLLGSAWQSFLHPDDLADYLKAYAAAWRGPAPFEHQFRQRNAGGHYRWMMSMALPRYGPTGELNGYVGSMFDIGEFKEAEAVLREADQAKNSFIAMLAHELRNPLASLVNATEIIRSERATAEQVQRSQSVLRRQLRNLTRMVDDLLDISRVTQGKILLRKETVELQQVLRRAAESFTAAGETERVELTLELPEEPILLRGDAVRLEQIASNLLSNAFKFTPAGGHIRMQASRVVTPTGPHAEMIVEDDGPGIDPAILERIFEVFVQGDSSAGRNHAGLGIGLSLVRNLTQLHGGTVKASNLKTGRGSRFTVCLPLPG